MALEVAELHVLELRVELLGAEALAEELSPVVKVASLGLVAVGLGHELRSDVCVEVGRQGRDAPGGAPLGVMRQHGHFELGRRVDLLLGPDALGVGLEVPPHVTEEGLLDRGARVHVTRDALGRGNRVGQLVADRVAGFVGGDAQIGIVRVASTWNEDARATVGAVLVVGRRALVVSVLRVALVLAARAPAVGAERVEGVAVVGIDHVAARAAARAEVAGVIVGPQHVQRRVHQSRPLEVEPDWIDSVQGPESALAEAVERAPRLFLERAAEEARRRESEQERASLPALEDPENVAGLSDLEPREGIETSQLAATKLRLGALDRVLGERAEHALRLAVGIVALAEAGLLERVGAVVVEGRLPEHGRGRHHALLDLDHRLGVTTHGSAGERGDAQIARVHEPNELPVLCELDPVGDLGVARADPVAAGPARPAAEGGVGRAVNVGRVFGRVEVADLLEAAGREATQHGITRDVADADFAQEGRQAVGLEDLGHALGRDPAHAAVAVRAADRALERGTGVGLVLADVAGHAAKGANFDRVVARLNRDVALLAGVPDQDRSARR